MPDDPAHDDVRAAMPALRTLAGEVDWLISTSHPAGRGPYSDAEVAALIRETTGEPVTATAITSCAAGRPPTRVNG